MLPWEISVAVVVVLAQHDFHSLPAEAIQKGRYGQRFFRSVLRWIELAPPEEPFVFEGVTKIVLRLVWGMRHMVLL